MFPHVPLVKKSSFPQRSRCLNFISMFSFGVFSFPIREGNNRLDNQLFYSKSDVFPFGRLLGGAEQKYRSSMDENCNYVVNEPLTTPDSDHAKVIGEEKRKASGSRRRCDYRWTLPSSTESENGKSRILIGPRTRLLILILIFIWVNTLLILKEKIFNQQYQHCCTPNIYYSCYRSDLCLNLCYQKTCDY